MTIPSDRIQLRGDQVHISEPSRTEKKNDPEREQSTIGIVRSRLDIAGWEVFSGTNGKDLVRLADTR